MLGAVTIFPAPSFFAYSPNRWMRPFKEVYQMQTDFEAVVEAEFAEVIDKAISQQVVKVA